MVLRCRPEVLASLERKLKVTGFDQVCDALDVDVRSGPSIGLTGPHLPATGELKEGGRAVSLRGNVEVRRNVWGIETSWAPGHTYTYSFSLHPLRDIDPDDYTWPGVEESDLERVKTYRMMNQGYCMYAGVAHLFETAWQLAGFSEFLVMMRENPERASRVLDELDSIRTRQAELLIEAGVDVVVDGDDVGAQTSMIVSPELWRKFLKPRYRELIRVVHRGGVKFLFHSDGWIEPIVPDLIEIGVDILNPMQPEVMDPRKMKKLYGDRICFDGTMSIQRTLPFGTEHDVQTEVAARIDELGPTGLILGPSHDIQTDTSVEKVLALYRSPRTPRR